MSRLTRDWEDHESEDDGSFEATARVVDARPDERDRAGRGGAAAPAAGRLPGPDPRPRAAVAGPRGGPPPRHAAGPRAAVRSPRARQDHAGDDRRHRARAADPRHRRVRPSSTPATSPRSCPRWPRARCCSSTRSTGCRGRPRRCSTSPWRTSGSTSSSARARARRPSRWSCRRSPWWAPPRGPGCCRRRCATGSGSPATSTSTRPTSSAVILRRSRPAARGRGRRGRHRRDRDAVPRHTAHRQPAAAPGPRLGPGARPGRRRPRRRAAWRWRCSTSTSAAWTGSTGRCSSRCAAGSAGDRSA